MHTFTFRINFEQRINQINTILWLCCVNHVVCCVFLLRLHSAVCKTSQNLMSESEDVVCLVFFQGLLCRLIVSCELCCNYDSVYLQPVGNCLLQSFSYSCSLCTSMYHYSQVVITCPHSQMESVLFCFLGSSAIVC